MTPTPARKPVRRSESVVVSATPIVKRRPHVAAKPVGRKSPKVGATPAPPRKGPLNPTPAPSPVYGAIRTSADRYVAPFAGTPAQRKSPPAVNVLPVTRKSTPIANVSPAARKTLPTVSPGARKTLPTESPGARKTLPTVSPAARKTLPTVSPAARKRPPTVSPVARKSPNVASSTPAAKKNFESFLNGCKIDINRVKEQVTRSLEDFKKILGVNNQHVKRLSAYRNDILKIMSSFPKSTDDSKIGHMTDRDARSYVDKMVSSAKTSARNFTTYEHSVIGTCIVVLVEDLEQLKSQIEYIKAPVDVTVQSLQNKLSEILGDLVKKFEQVHGDTKMNYFLNRIVQVAQDLKKLKQNLINRESSLEAFLGTILVD